jgi:hypothetical protein
MRLMFLGLIVGMGILLATVWVNLALDDTKIVRPFTSFKHTLIPRLVQNDRLSVHFFSVAFLGFMSVAGIPSFLEERQVFIRERHNGLYGPGPYVIANSVVSLPFLAICTGVFCVVWQVLCKPRLATCADVVPHDSYWSIGLHDGAANFFKFFIFLFCGVYVAESQVKMNPSSDLFVRPFFTINTSCLQSILVAAAIPIFVAALAIASFLNGQSFYTRSRAVIDVAHIRILDGNVVHCERGLTV